ncbi:MAG: stage II sporulation protein P, partial [Oscillospiraceae bacterium]
MDLVKLSRRALALLLALLALWLLWVNGSGSADATTQRLFTPPGSEGAASAGNELGLWERLIVRQSPYLKAGQVLMGSGTAAAENTPDPEKDENTDGELLWTSTDSGNATGDSSNADEEPPPSAVPQAQHVIAQTLLPATDGSYPSVGGVFLYNRTSQAVDMEALAQAEIALGGGEMGPQILIVHTHATESYTKAGQDNYQESDPYRTTDDAHNVVRVGDEMAAAFAQAGLNVLHDRTLHDYPNYNGAYTRSRETVERYLAAYPSISVVLDVHRDAIMGENDAIYKVVTDKAVAEDCAQVMLVVGTQEGGGSHPNWRQNLAFAMALERRMNQDMPTQGPPQTHRKYPNKQARGLGN